MEPKFVARAKPTMEGMRALVRAAYGRRLRSRVSASALVGALAVGFLFWSGVKPFSLVILALACAFLWFFARAQGRMAQKLLAASPNQALETEFRFMDDALYTQNSEEAGKTEYSAIARVWETKDHFAFYLTNGSAFAIPKSGFARGDVSRFGGFMQKVTGKETVRA